MNHRKLTPADKEKLASIGYNREGYESSTKVTVVDERGSRQVEHFDGRVDAEVRPKVVKLTARKTGD